MSKFTFDKLQPWVEMLCDALENKGSSSSGIPNPQVFPYADKYRTLLSLVRNKEITQSELESILDQYQTEIQQFTNQPYRTKNLTDGLRSLFIRELLK